MKFSAIIEQASDWLQGKSLSTSGVEVVNTLAYLVQLYKQQRISLDHILADFTRLTRRGTLKPEWLQAALTLVGELRKKDKDA